MSTVALGMLMSFWKAQLCGQLVHTVMHGGCLVLAGSPLCPNRPTLSAQPRHHLAFSVGPSEA